MFTLQYFALRRLKYPSPSFEIVCLVAVENAMEPTTPNRCIHRSSWWSLLGGLIINRCSHRFDPALAAQASSDCHWTSSGPICSTLAVVFSMALERSCLLALFGAVWIYFLVARFLGQVVEICGNHWFTWLDICLEQFHPTFPCLLNVNSEVSRRTIKHQDISRHKSRNGLVRKWCNPQFDVASWFSPLKATISIHWLYWTPSSMLPAAFAWAVCRSLCNASAPLHGWAWRRRTFSHWELRRFQGGNRSSIHHGFRVVLMEHTFNSVYFFGWTVWTANVDLPFIPRDKTEWSPFKREVNIFCLLEHYWFAIMLSHQSR